VTTPRKSPSRRAADGSEWRVTADKFAEVLDATGFSRDAFDVVLTGDDASATDNLTHIAFARLIGETARTVESISTEEIRYAMLAIASGRSLEEIRFQVGAALFAVLQANTERLTPQKAAAVLSEYFEIDEIVFEEEEAAATVFGASLVHFPKKFRTRYDYSPVSSHITR
jgi:5-carboxymethyl-2-hydroxymuconate isomerase